MIKSHFQKICINLAAIGSLVITSMAYAAAPATVFINMDNQLKQNVEFIFKFKKENIEHAILFPAGKSNTSISIQDDSMLSTDIAASFKDNIQSFPCTITSVASFQPHNLWVRIGSEHSCQIGHS